MESFFRTVTIVNVSKSQHSLRDKKGSGIVLSLFQTFTHTPLKLNKISFAEKRILSGIFFPKKQNRRLRASMTVEAALALPIFLFCMMNLIYSIHMIETQSRLLAAAHQMGNRICFHGYGELHLPKGIPDVEGLSFLGSSIRAHDDLVNLQISWQARPFASGQGFAGFRMKTGYYGRAWTGYDVTNGAAYDSEDETMVYITEKGTVYHLRRDCYHLCPTIVMVSSDAVSSMRNNSGAKYKACASCVRGSIQMVCYITPEGTKYHNNPNCSGLKRTIYTIPLSEVGGRPACSNCGR